MALAAALAAAPLRGQAPAAPPSTAPVAAAKSAPPASAPSAEEPKLIFDREVFDYPAAPRRDPFTPLVGKNDMGPRFEDLSVRGIIYAPAGRSLVVLSDGKKTYRRRSGEMVGNARVGQISPTRVIFSVDNFGSWHQETLELKKNPEGAKG